MGLRSWILGFDPKEVEGKFKEMEKKITYLENSLKLIKLELKEVTQTHRQILMNLNEKADKDDLKDVRLRLNSLTQTLDNLIMKIEGLEISLQRDQILTDDEAKKELILRLIREGYNTPKELKSMVPFGNKKLYEILTELEKKGLIKKLKKKRKVVYIAEEEAY